MEEGEHHLDSLHGPNRLRPILTGLVSGIPSASEISGWFASRLHLPAIIFDLFAPAKNCITLDFDVAGEQ